MEEYKQGLEKYWDCSTAHITPQDNEILSSNPRNCPVIFDECEYGYWTYVPAEAKDQEFKDELSNYGFSEYFIRLMEIACGLGATWIMIDGDGMIYDTLAQFDW